jgi:stage III sporulation protein SpoIIIAA
MTIYQQDKILNKIIFNSGDHDVGLIGYIIFEDDFFITIESSQGKTFRIGKASIKVIKPLEEVPK